MTSITKEVINGLNGHAAYILFTSATLLQNGMCTKRDKAKIS
jgi:hypothetical protein